MVKRILSLAVLAFAVIAFTSPNLAQAQQQDADPAAFDSLITALNSVDQQALALENVDSTTADVRIVNVADVSENLTEEQVEILNSAIDGADVMTLHGALNNNQALSDALAENAVMVEDVVAVDALSGGNVVIYTR